MRSMAVLLVAVCVVAAGMTVLWADTLEPLPQKGWSAPREVGSLDENCMPADCVTITLDAGFTHAVLNWYAPQPGVYGVYRATLPNPGPYPGPDWSPLGATFAAGPQHMTVTDPVALSPYAQYVVMHDCPLPTNDACANAVAIGNGTTWFSTIGATTDGPHPNGCTQIYNDIWFLYTATCSGALTISLCGSNYDAMAALYTVNCPTLGIVFDCSDDDCGLSPILHWDNVAAGEQYRIRVGGWGGAWGTGQITITPGVQHNSCALADTLAEGVATPFSTVCATTDGPSGPNSCYPRGDVWYRYTATGCGYAVASTCGSSFDTQIAIYDATDCGSLTTPVACNDDSNGCANGLNSIVRFETTYGQEFLIRVGGYLGATGTGQIEVDQIFVYYFNDACGNAALLAPGVYDYTNVCAGGNGPVVSCGGDIYHDLWYQLQVTANSSYTVSLCGSNFDTRLALYNMFLTTCADLPVPFACNDDAPGCAPQSTLTFSTGPILLGPTYLRIGGAAAGEWGNIHLVYSQN